MKIFKKNKIKSGFLTFEDNNYNYNNNLNKSQGPKYTH